MMGGTDLNTQAQRAWIIFTGHTEILWLRLLKPGFRHCYVLINDGKVWTSFDPLSHVIEISTHHHIAADYDLPAWLETQGNRVIEATVRRDLNRPAPFMFFTCVESCKRYLGIHNRWIFTPWALYRFLTAQRGQQSCTGQSMPS